MKSKIKQMRVALLLAVVVLFTITAAPSAKAVEAEESIYGPYDSFIELYNAYMDAVEAGDQNLIDELVEIGHTSLQAEIEMSESQAIQPRYDAIAAEWAARFPEFFSYGYFEKRDNGWTLSMAPYTKHIWSDQEKSDGWQATYGKFKDNTHWDNTEIMKEQFYCHARLGYSFAQTEWNLEPWRTQMDPFTCNDPLTGS